VTADIDDTVDVVHGRQQLSLFDAHYDERCVLPLHIYDTMIGRRRTRLALQNPQAPAHDTPAHEHCR
jgi:hypothetical protein